MALRWFSWQFVLVELRFDVWFCAAVDAEQFVVSAHYRSLGTEHGVLQKDTGALVVRPVERRVGVAFTFHFSLSVWLRFREQLACNCQAPSV